MNLASINPAAIWEKIQALWNSAVASGEAYLEGLLKLLEYGYLTQAGYAPACPHVNVYVLATEGAEVYYVALTVLEYDALGEGLSGYGGAVLGKVDGVLRAEAIALGGLL